MFDVGFSEIVLIAVVALVVVGPEKLPKLARTLGALVGRVRGYVATVKGEVEREMQFEELKKLQQHIHSQNIQSEQMPSEVKKSRQRKTTAKPQSTSKTKKVTPDE